MANTNAPFGFRSIGRLPGAAGNFELSWRKISGSDSTAVFNGSPVTSLNTGYIARSAPSTSVPVAGIATAFAYNSLAKGGYAWFPYWSGSTADVASGDVDCGIINDPAAMFVVQASSAAVAFSDINALVQFVTATGNTLSGISAETLGAIDPTSSAYPFRIIGLYPAVNISSAGIYNQAIVTFNFQDFKVLTGT